MNAALIALVKVLRRLDTRLARIEQAMQIEHHEQEKHMSEIDDELTAVENALTVLDADEQRELADLTALQQAQPLSPEEKARFDALVARVQADDAAINAADAAPVDTTPVDGSGDGTEPAPAE